MLRRDEENAGRRLRKKAAKILSAILAASCIMTAAGCGGAQKPQAQVKEII